MSSPSIINRGTHLINTSFNLSTEGMNKAFTALRTTPLMKRISNHFTRNYNSFLHHSTDPQQSMPIIGLLALIPGLGLIPAILGIVISRSYWPLPLRAERGFWLCVMGACIHGLVIAGLITAATITWLMNMLSTII